MKLSIVGLGLMGCSAAMDLKRRGFAETVRGCDANPLHAKTALQLEIVESVGDLETVIDAAELIILAVPVDAAIDLLPRILDRTDRQTVTDFCSTKALLAETVRNHPQRNRYVGSHPMAGIEKSGPGTARSNLFDGKAAILCDSDRSDPDARERVTRMYEALSMNVLRMSSTDHDRLTACISHLPHALAYALVLTVLREQETSPDILRMASGGFYSVARLAKSSPEMWAPIFLSNADFVSREIDDFIGHLVQLQTAIQKRDAGKIKRLLEAANRIRDPYKPGQA